MFDELDAVEVVGAMAPCDVLFVCEHASCAFPEFFGDLGLTAEAQKSHVAWDPGALALTRTLAHMLNAPYVAGRVSRLLYDCNRPPEAESAIPSKSEIYAIPGNANLSPEQRDARVELVYRPFQSAVRRAVQQVAPKALVTVHSFTPVYHGKQRAVELGVLHDLDTRLADGMLRALKDAPFEVQRNAPYGPEDGVTHSLKAYALPSKIPNVMLEVRNDLLVDASSVARVSEVIVTALTEALAEIEVAGGAC